MIELPEDNVSHVRVARSPQLGHRLFHRGGGGGGLFGGRFAQPQPDPAPAAQPGVAQSQATANARSFSLRGDSSHNCF